MSWCDILMYHGNSLSNATHEQSLQPIANTQGAQKAGPLLQQTIFQYISDCLISQQPSSFLEILTLKGRMYQ
jgi:hypothetical protein